MLKKLFIIGTSLYMTGCGYGVFPFGWECRNVEKINVYNGKLDSKYSECRSERGERWLRFGKYVEYSDGYDKIKEGYYNNSDKVGLWKHWHGNGKLSLKGKYEDGKRVGLWQTWHRNGQLELKGEYDQSIRVGSWQEWYANGQLKQKGEYDKESSKVGLWGNDSNKVGLWEEWYDNGQLKQKGEYDNDSNKVGLWRKWDLEGNLKSETNH